MWQKKSSCGPHSASQGREGTWGRGEGKSDIRAHVKIRMPRLRGVCVASALQKTCSQAPQGLVASRESQARERSAAWAQWGEEAGGTCLTPSNAKQSASISQLRPWLEGGNGGRG